jgi:hypothetical protein
MQSKGACELDRATIEVLFAAESLMEDQLTYMKKVLYEQEETDQLVSQDIRGVVHELVSRGITGTQKEQEMRSMLAMLNESLILKKTFDISRRDTQAALQKLNMGPTDLRLVDYPRFKRANMGRIMDLVCDEEKVDRSILRHKDYSVNIELATISCYSEYIAKFNSQLKILATAIKYISANSRAKPTSPTQTPLRVTRRTQPATKWHQNLTEIRHRIEVEHQKLRNNVVFLDHFKAGLDLSKDSDSPSRVQTPPKPKSKPKSKTSIQPPR